MSSKTSYLDIIKLSGPLVLANIAIGIGQLVDTAFINRVGEYELNGTVMASMVWMFFSFIIAGFSIYVQRLIAKENGKKNYEKIGKIFNSSIAIGIGLLVLILGVYVIIATLGFKWMIKDENIIFYALTYLNTLMLSLPIIILNRFFSALFTAINKTLVVGYALFAFIVANLVSDYLLIFGHFGMPKLGVMGAALATIIGLLACFIVYVIYIFKYGLIKKMNLFKVKTVQKRVIYFIVNKSLPLVLQNLLSVTVSWVFFVFIEKMGGAELRVSLIIRSLYLFLCIPVFGLGQAVNALISNLIGKGEKESLFDAIFKSHFIGFAISLVLCLLVLFFPEVFLGIYTDDVNEIYNAIPVVKIILISILLFSITTINTNIIIAIGDTKYVFVIGVLSFTFYLLFAYIAVFIWEASIFVVWLSDWVNLGVFILLSTSYFFFAKNAKVVQKV